MLICRPFVKAVAWSSCALIFCAFSGLLAAPVTVPNHSFEAPDVPDGGATGTVPGWTVSASSTGGGMGGATITDPLGTPAANLDGDQYLYIYGNVPSQGSVTVTATSSNSLLTIAGGTTYSLTVAARVYGPGAGGSFALLADGAVASFGIVPNASVSTPVTNYTIAFTTGASEDIRVGKPLTIQLVGTCTMAFGGAANVFDNVRLGASPVSLSVALDQGPPARLNVSWPTNFQDFTLESATNLTNPSWSELPNAHVPQGTNFVVTLELGPPRQFFRLRKF